MIDIEELRDAAQKAFPAGTLMPARDASWELIAGMGWLMMRLGEEDGGLGLGREASTAIHYELGRVLSGAPFIPALLTIEAIAASSTLEDREGWIERSCAGELITLNLSAGNVECAGDGSLSGTLPAVFDADMASHVLICLSDLALLVPTGAEGVAIRERDIWDKSRRLFDVTLDRYQPAPGLVLARGEQAHRIASTLREEMLLALAADCLGGAAAALDMTVDYLKTRRQFDRPLAMFQSLKHRCADLKTRIASAEALLWERARNAEAGASALGALKTLAAEVYEMVTEEAIQLHGGIGLTREHHCHLFMKRAMLNLALGGTPDEWYEAAGRQALTDFTTG
ncbi:MAG: acyl-CoA dehydrogenase family protein [Novosphingobium sp.]|nr:acyl-CoA dehydrogenase family protein [Novosphingobium sp.]